MKWLKLIADHGPGHQVRTEEIVPWRWEDLVPEEDKRLELIYYLNDWVLDQGFLNASARVEILKEIPEELRRALLDRWEKKKEIAQLVLDDLYSRDPSRNPPAHRT